MRKFCDSELSPYADQIDRDNDWSELRSFWKKLGDMGMLGITAPGWRGGRGWSIDLEEGLEYWFGGEAKILVWRRGLNIGLGQGVCYDQDLKEGMVLLIWVGR